MRLTICSRLVFLFSLLLFLSQWQTGETATSKQDEVTPTPLPTSTVAAEVTTKKSGFFGGIKKFFGRSSTTTAVPIDEKTTTAKAAAATTTTTTVRTTTVKSNPIPTVKKQIIPASNPFGAGGAGGGQANPSPPGFPQLKPQKPLPSGLELSYGGGEIRPPPRGVPPNPAPADNSNNPKVSTTPSTVSVSSGPTFATTTTTTTKKPKDDFPPLPTPKVPIGITPSSIPTPTPSNVWNKPGSPQSGSIPQIPSSGVSFVPHLPEAAATTTVRPGFPTDKPILATDDEIRQLTEDLYAKETMSQLSRIHVHLQGKTRSIDSTDEAPQPLLEIDEKAFETPSITKMRALFNNYEMDAGVNEHVSPREREEEQEFVEIISSTVLMRHAMLFLQNKGVVTSDPKTHKDLLKELWFTQYSRLSGKVGSSGFEHVFVNEVKNGTIIGLHNWVYFYEQEKAGKLDYKGYLNSADLGEKGKVVKVRFSHNGNNKPVNTLFIGTSPELEVALYTLCFKLRPDRTCPVSLGGTKFGIVTYSWRHRGKDLIGSAFPEI